jgi:hypothetical protein
VRLTRSYRSCGTIVSASARVIGMPSDVPRGGVPIVPHAAEDEGA